MIYSFNYGDIKRNNDTENWDGTLQLLTKAGLGMKAAGAEDIVLCANTMHLIADRLEQNIQLPVIHNSTVTAESIKKADLDKVVLLGTKFKKERNFFRDKLTESGIDVL